MFKKFLGCIREYKLPTLLTFLFLLLEAAIEALIPTITARLVNSIGENMVLSDILKPGLTLVLMAMLSLCCGAAAGFTSAKASAGFAKNLRYDVFKQVQGFGFSNIDKFSSASLVTRLTTDITHVQMAYLMIIRTAVRAPLMLVFSIVMAFTMAGKLAASFVIMIPFLAFGLFLISRFAMPAFSRVFKKYDRLNESIEENVRGIRVVKGFAREDYEKEKFNKDAENIRVDFTKAERIVALNSPLMQICIYFNMLFVLTVGSKLIIAERFIDVGQISAMLTYGMQILMQLMMLSMIYVMLTISSESMKRISEVLLETSSLVSKENGIHEVKDGSIEFKNVSFSYNQKAKKPALSNINVSIKSGMTVGIIGGTGSSKSTLVQLIPRLYDATKGSVKVGGIDVKEYDLTSLRNAVSMVLQKNVLFSGTISDNLRWGNQNATEEEMVNACRIAEAHDFVMGFENGYETKIEQGGTNVSGGQKQRLCIARALLKKPKILILDDSTSAVDTKTDMLIRTRLKEYLPETTKIIIAQRISSVQDSDLILVLDGGKISAAGTHEELLETSEIYKEVYAQQTSGGEENA